MRNIRGISLFWILFLDGGETAPYLASAAEQVKGESFSGIGVWALNSKPISAAPRSPVCLNTITIKGFYQESPHTECSMTWKTFAAQDLKKRVSSDDDFILNPGRSRGVSERIWPVWTGLCRAYLLQQGQRAHPLEAHFSWIGTCQPGWRCFPVPFPGDSLRPGLSLAVSTEGCSHARASAAAQGQDSHHTVKVAKSEASSPYWGTVPPWTQRLLSFHHHGKNGEICFSFTNKCFFSIPHIIHISWR